MFNIALNNILALVIPRLFYFFNILFLVVKYFACIFAT
nr:MAG TPA: hypothetical protein [Ackermannviridae sp.]